MKHEVTRTLKNREMVDAIKRYFSSLSKSLSKTASSIWRCNVTLLRELKMANDGAIPEWAMHWVQLYSRKFDIDYDDPHWAMCITDKEHEFVSIARAIEASEALGYMYTYDGEGNPCYFDADDPFWVEQVAAYNAKMREMLDSDLPF